MAIWQFNIELLPKYWAEKNGFRAEALLENGECSTEIAWNSNPVKENFQEIISQVFPKADSWSDQLLIWGNTEKNDIQAFYSKEILSCIHIRLDLRENPQYIIDKIVDLAYRLDCVLFFPEQNVILKASVKNITELVKKSKAQEFVNNPKLFLERINENPKPS